MQSLITEFEKHLNTIPRKLSTVQVIVEFYLWFKMLSQKEESFDQQLKAAKRIKNWSKGDLGKAFELIVVLASFMESRNLHYTLDTIHKNIKSYVAEKRKEAEQKEMSNWYYQQTREIERKLGKNKNPVQ